MKLWSVILFVLLGVCRSCCGLHLEFAQREPLSICVDDCVTVTLRFSGIQSNKTVPVVLRIRSRFDTIAKPTPTTLQVNATSWSGPIEICGMGGGFTVITAKINSKSAYMPVIVSRERTLKVISELSGWIYFFAWSISYYPQIFTNYSRKSVVGLNFDFVSLNIIGFFLYSMYNCGMYFSSTIQHEYFGSHPRSINPVMLNDVIFSLHAFFATSVITYHCCVYERGTQKVSGVAKFIISLYFVIFVISGFLVYTGTDTWLDFLLYCSYIKLTVTMIKYIPQAIMNYSRKSTVGWSILNVLFDFAGGIFSMLQMAINCYNYDDMDSIFGDPTKFGLGLFSAMFDVFFMYQHYVLYSNPYEEHVDDESPVASETTTNENVQTDGNTEGTSTINSTNVEMAAKN